MKKYKKRVVFGSEKTLIQSVESQCEECGVSPKKPHDPGCLKEECPQCGRPMVTCGCGCLSPHDSAPIIQALFKQFEGLEEALGSLEAMPPPPGAGPSLLQHAVMQYVFHVAPDTVKHEITEAFHLRFPGLIPALQDEKGKGYYTVDQLAKALGVSPGEVQERIEAMETAGQDIERSEGKDLHKVH